jgi:hypothetical protein
MQRKGFSRRGVSGLLSAIFLFAMLFTTGSAYILFVTDSQFKIQDTAKAALARDIQRMSEEITIETSELGNGHLGATITNSGSEPLQVIQILVLGANSSLLKNIQSPTLPITLNVQTATATPVDTNITIQQGSNYTVKVITARGSLFSEAYPSLSNYNMTTIISSVVASDIAKSIGSIAMDTTTLQYSQDDGNTWSQGWYITVINSSKIIWRVNVTNMMDRDIYLSKYSQFLFLRIVPNSGLQPEQFYITTNTTSGHYPSLSDTDFLAQGGALIPANASSIVTLYLKLSEAGGKTPSDPGSNLDAGKQYFTALELFGTYDSPTSTSYYGQSLPFVGVLTP